MTEQTIQAAIIKALEKKGCYVVKIMQTSKAGVADLLVCHAGSFIALEIKTPSGRVSPLQEYHGQKVVDAGGRFAVVRSVSEALGLLF